MNRIKPALKYASFFGVLLIIMSFIINTSINGIKEAIKDVNYIGFYSFLIFSIPSFIAFFNFYKQKFEFKKMLKLFVFSIAISFVISYLLYISNLFISKNFVVPFFNLGSVLNGTISVFVFLFWYLIIYVIKNSRTKISSTRRSKLWFGENFIIYLVVTFLYLFIVAVLGGLEKVTPSFLIYIFSFGLLTSIISILVFYRIKAYRILSSIILYLFTSLFFPFLISLLFFKQIKDPKNMIISIVVFGPYFLFLVLSQHANFIFSRKKEENQFLKQESLESRLNYQQLKNQLSPHFLFNNINVLTSLIEENPKKAVAFSESLSNIYRYFLEQEKEDIIELKKEIDFAKKYLLLFQTRFELGLTYTIHVNELDQNKYVVSTTLQQVLENVIKHNEISNENAVSITIASKNDFLVITNNINPKISDIKNGGKGLENIKKRYAYFSDIEVVINQNELNFTIKLPLLDV